MRFLNRFGLLMATVLVITAAGCASAKPFTITTQTATTTILPVTINLSGAASTTNVLTEINKLYTQLKPWVTITPSWGSSGTLVTQIQNGAPCDVFISADAANMNKLDSAGLLLTGSRINLLTNKMVLIVPKGNLLNLTGFADLTLAKVKLIGVGDPKSTPLGAYAQQAFTELGILSAIQSKFILGATVTQVLQYVDSGNVDAGIVFSTDALSDNNVTVIAIGPADVNATIVYPIAIINVSKVTAAAQDYINFLTGLDAKAIFEKYGFVMAGK